MISDMSQFDPITRIYYAFIIVTRSPDTHYYKSGQLTGPEFVGDFVVSSSQYHLLTHIFT